eukprot:TRINITY_DN18253_c0_g1_i1.p1 TRINITY_DN18253_c0_g1~~TRINITY_DN18253_c0_g1_i1.p1  ORF type:complete len:459 (-),score=61.34 TRINITY_DN18253_c0_g1_i1:166-1512(-)
MKIKAISRDTDECGKEVTGDLARSQRNYDPTLHPFARQREYKRALNSAKLERVFAKPFISALSGHNDGVFSLARDPTTVNVLLSGSCDGEVKIWHLSTHTAIHSIPKAHTGFVRGLISYGNSFLSCGDDNQIKHWKLDIETATERIVSSKLTQSFEGRSFFTGIDIAQGTSFFGTSGSAVEIWNLERSSPVNTYQWGVDTFYSIRFCPSEPRLFLTAAADRSITLYDTRLKTEARKVILRTKTNALSWNPQVPFQFAAANEDNNAYTFDTRRFSEPSVIHKGHLAPVLDVDFSPTGLELVCGSYDHTVRIFNAKSTVSRDVYHTQRMQRIFVTRFSGDGKYVMSGSDDTNIRLWKSEAAKPLGVLPKRSVQSLNYHETLKKKYRHVNEIQRILKHRHLPRPLYSLKKRRAEHDNAQFRKKMNIIRHSKKDDDIQLGRKKGFSVVSEVE